MVLSGRFREARFALGPGTTTIGREAGCEVRLAAIRARGGDADPAAISKALGLSAQARRRLVPNAVAAGLARTKGRRRGTRYLLARR